MDKGCFKSNASYFIMLAHDVRGECWWYGYRGWTFHQYSVTLCCCETDDSRGAVQQMVYDMEVQMKQRCGIEILYEDKTALSDTNQCLLNVYGDQTVGVSSVRRWVVHLSSGDSDVKEKPCSGQPCWFLWVWLAGSCSSVAKMCS